MKIYINNLNINVLNDISELFKEYLVNTETYIELYTNEGIYHIEDKHIYFLDVCDKELKIHDKYYNNFTLIVDPSFFNKKICSSINGETHLSFQIIKKYYKLNKLSNLSMIIKYVSDNKNQNLLPKDIYFEYEKDVDINDFLIKKEFIEFLSVLN